jgi:hypothetical protein
MTNAVQVIKEYIATPEGSQWFMNAVKSAQEKIRASEENLQLSHADSEENDEKKNETFLDLPLLKQERKLKSLTASRRDLEMIIQWTEKHPSQEKDGRYILRVASAGGRQILKPTLLMRGEKVSSSQLINDDPKKILSGDITRVTTRGTHTETYNISLTQ